MARQTGSGHTCFNLTIGKSKRRLCSGVTEGAGGLFASNFNSVFTFFFFFGKGKNVRVDVVNAKFVAF